MASMMSVRMAMYAVMGGLCIGVLPAQAQTAPAPPAAPVHAQVARTVNAPIDLFGVPVRVSAPNPVAYIGSAYRNDIGGQSESNSDPAIAEDTQARPGRFDAW